MYNLNIESMTNVTLVPTKNKYFNIKLKNLKHMPLIDIMTYNNVTKLEDINKILNLIDSEKNYLNIKDRKNIIKLIPFINHNILQNVNYNSLKTFIKQSEPTNFINIVKLKSIPSLLNLNNTIIINNYLYKITQYGIIKYVFNNNFRIDDNATILNASFESTILNDINLYNKSNHPIVIIKGEPYKIINNKIYNIKDNQIFELNIPKSEINNFKSTHTIKIFHNQDKMYTIQNNKIYPNKDIGIKLNNFIKNNELNVYIIVPLFYFINGQLISRILFICNSNLYFYIENNSISELLDFEKDFGFKYNYSKEDLLQLDQYNTALSHTSLSNNINNKLKSNIINSLYIKFNNP